MARKPKNAEKKEPTAEVEGKPEDKTTDTVVIPPAGEKKDKEPKASTPAKPAEEKPKRKRMRPKKGGPSAEAMWFAESTVKSYKGLIDRCFPDMPVEKEETDSIEQPLAYCLDKYEATKYLPEILLAVNVGGGVAARIGVSIKKHKANKSK